MTECNLIAAAAKDTAVEADGGKQKRRNKIMIAISSTGNTDSALSDPRFGRCEYFAIYNPKNSTYTFIENKAQSASGGAGIAASQQLIDIGVETVLTGNLGPNAYNVLKSAGIRAYRTASVKVCEAVELFKNGKLAAIDEAGEAHAGMKKGFRGGLE